MPQNPNPQYYRREQMTPDGRRWSFSFDSIADYDKFIADTVRTSTAAAKRNLDKYTTGNGVREGMSMGQRWFGTTDPSQVRGNLDTFLYRDDLQRILSNITNRINTVSLADIDQQKSIKFTEQEIGIFSFDLASLGLIKVFEYYSPLTKGLVSPNLVQSYKNNSGQTIYYFVGQKYVPAQEIEYNFKTGGFYNAQLDKNIPRDELTLVEEGNRTFYRYGGQDEIPRHDVERRQKKNEDGSKKYATTFKKCFVHIPKVEKPLPRIDIIVPFSFSGNDDADTLKYNAIPTIALAESLSRIGINYRIVATYPVNLSGYRVYQYIVLKKEGEALDKNKMALFMGDPRYYRYQRFRGIMAAFSDINQDNIVGDGNWSTITDTDEIKRNYVDFLAKSSNVEDVEASKRLNSKIVQNPISSERRAIDEYTRIIDIIKSL